MKYLLVEDRKIIHLQTEWKSRYIQSELDDLEIDYVLPPTEQGYIKINDNFELIPIVGDETEICDETYQQLAGPYWRYSEESVVMYHDVLDRPLEDIKNTFKQKTSSERYRKENLGKKITIQEQEVSLSTSRDSRNNFIHAFLLMNESSTLNWKFAEGFLNLSYTDMTSIISSINSYVQEQFDWEFTKFAEIDACVSVDELKLVKIVPETTNSLGI